MLHGVADFDSRWKTVADEAARFGFKNGQQILIGREVFLRAVYCSRELAFKFFSRSQHLAPRTAFDHERRGAENFIHEGSLSQEGPYVRDEQLRMGVGDSSAGLGWSVC